LPKSFVLIFLLFLGACSQYMTQADYESASARRSGFNDTHYDGQGVSSARGAFREQMARQRLQMSQGAVPHTGRVHYPENWREISRTRRALPPMSFLSGNSGGSGANVRLKRTLVSKHVTFDFDDDDFNEALDLIRLQGVQVIIPSEKLNQEIKDAKISMTGKNMRLLDAVQFIFSYNDYGYRIKGGALVLYPADEIRGSAKEEDKVDLIELWKEKDKVYNPKPPDYPPPEGLLPDSFFGK